MHYCFLFSILLDLRGFENYDISNFQLVKGNVMINDYKISYVEIRNHAVASNMIEGVVNSKGYPNSNPNYHHGKDN
jgi:hypothetical protein